MSAALALVPGTTQPVDTEPLQPEDFADDLHADVEALFLCALLWAPQVAAKHSVGILEPTDFARPLHREFFILIRGLIESGAPHNAAMVGAALERSGDLAGHLGSERSRHLANITTLGAEHTGIDHYAHAVFSQAYRRSFATAAAALTQAAQELPAHQLYEHMCEIGRRQRALTERRNTIEGDTQ
ncbi:MULTISPECIES: DnaB-like helicase N-terminal domain-containing protein [Rhodococcus]|uniref:DnaB-like helicase N-terminal domain-containing protein n=1 Tax=Rhodococcus TaxID=1827 RepID=UPI0029548D1E|nr:MULTISPECIES: DnaB-like helicase N-terminal domain-containing protein [Rhodococcus]MDV7246215.1 DnaB-like helicase N-terminal domain-containing protein [Rhodococcus oxybenzonivorans]MDV7337313.1 DnaB-like helicase N-terminal domain-containing protein [Rhodococcus oxybenzonivorans]MDV8031743.1 DnaB-like helicase N-terminal domain-containing protein [Rhodococcus sp. IEGM 27]